MPLDLIFVTPGNYTIEDDGIPGNGISVIKDGNGVVIFTFAHPADSLSFTASTPGVNLTIDMTDSLGAADFRIGNLSDPAQTPDSIVMKSLTTTGDVTLVSNGTITEGGSDATADIVAGTLVMSAVTGIGTAGNALETQTGFMEAETNTGGMAISNFGAVQIGGLSDLVNGLDVQTSGDLTLTALGSIFLSEVDLDTGNPPPAALESVHGGNTAGNIILSALGFDSDIIANTNRDAITASHGSIFLNAGRDIAFGTAGASFDNDVRASGGVTINAGRDFLIDGNSDLASDNFGLNTGGNLVINAARNVHVRNATGTDASVSATGNGGASVIVTTGPGGAVILDAPTSDALSSISGDVIITADRLLINTVSRISALNGEVFIHPRTDGREINLGSASDAAFAIELSDAELGRIFTPDLRIGDGATGQVTVSASVSFVNAPNVTLQSGTDVLIQASMNLTTSLTLMAGNNVFLLPSTINVPTFAAFADLAGDDGNTGGIIYVNALVAATNSILTGNSEADTLTGTSASEFMFGLGGNDALNGNGGTDTLDGGTGNDSMNGGLGDDVMLVDAVGDTVAEAVGEGNDRVTASLSYTLTAGASIETFNTSNSAGTTAINLTGNALAQSIVGNAGANTLDGGGGGDTMIGLGGNDFYFVRAAGDRAVEAAAAGNDRVFAAVSFALEAGSAVEILGTIDSAATTAINLTGNSLLQSIVGNAGANTLDSGGGGDTMLGLGGNDFFIVRTAGDRAVESAGAGTDRVFAAVSFTLEVGSSIETFTTIDSAATTAINLTGNALAQSIVGNAGANTLDSGGGGDVMMGLGGNDFYNIRAGTDRAVEAAGGGSDRVFAAVSFTLEAGSEVEIISTINQAASTAINLTGNALAQSIIGNAGANTLDSGGGGDTMIGVGGDDFYFVRAVGDRAVEAAASGSDRVFAAVSFTLEAGSSIEIFSTISNAAVDPINLTGNELGQSIVGNAGANVLDGKAAADTLTGLGGADTFGFTTALGGGNVDLITDFVAGTDKIRLENAIFTGLAAGALPANAFVVGAAAADADDRIIYNNATGALLFDADGNGAGAAVQFATLQGLPAISASDFTVI